MLYVLLPLAARHMVCLSVEEGGCEAQDISAARRRAQAALRLTSLPRRGIKVYT